MSINYQAGDRSCEKSCKRPTSAKKHPINPEDKLTLLQQRQLKFSLRANYFSFLVSQNYRIIQQTIRELQELDGDHSQLITSFMNILGNSAEKSKPTHEAIVFDFLNIIREKMVDYLAKMPREQIRFYQSVLIWHKEILENTTQYEAGIFESEMTLETLFKLDIFQTFLYQSYVYLKYTKATARLIKDEQIKHLFGFGQKQIERLLCTYKLTAKHVSYNLHKEFDKYSTLFHVIKIASSLNFMVHGGQKATVVDNNRLIEKYKIYSIPEFQDVHRQDQYSFCQVPFITIYQKEIEDAPYKNRCHIIKKLFQLSKQQDHTTLKRQILSIKVKYNLKFDSIYTYLNLIRNKKYQAIRKAIQPKNPTKKSELEFKFMYMFVTGDTIDEALNKFNLYEKYNLKNFERINPGMMDSTVTYINTTIKQYKYASLLADNMLKLEQSCNRQFIVVKKMVISFAQIRKYCKDSEGQAASKQNLTASLIMLSNRQQLKCICVVKGAIKDRAYVKILRRITSIVKKEYPFIVVLYAHQKKDQFEWNEYQNLYHHIKNQYDSRLYITNSMFYCELNILAFCYIKLILIGQASSINRDNFYQKVQIASLQIFNKLKKTNQHDKISV